jgi:hypothetical protein
VPRSQSDKLQSDITNVSFSEVQTRCREHQIDVLAAVWHYRLSDGHMLWFLRLILKRFELVGVVHLATPFLLLGDQVGYASERSATVANRYLKRMAQINRDPHVAFGRKTVPQGCAIAGELPQPCQPK